MLFSNSQFSLCLITPLPFAPMGTKDILIQQLIISCPGQGCLHCCFHSWRTHAQGLNAWSTGNFYWETLKKQYHPGQPEEVTSDPSPYFAFGSVLTVSSLQKHMRVFFIVVCMEAFEVYDSWKVCLKFDMDRLELEDEHVGVQCVYVFIVYLFVWTMVFQALLIERL